VVVKRKRRTPPAAPEQSASSSSSSSTSTPAAAAAAAAPYSAVSLAHLSKSLKDAHLERMLAQHQQYQAYFARLR
jgi:hypothetical protein